MADDGGRIDADLVVLAIGLEASSLVYGMGLPTRPKEGMRVNARLHSIADARVRNEQGRASGQLAVRGRQKHKSPGE